MTWRGSGGKLVSTADGYRFDVQIGAGRVFAGLIPQPAPMPALVSTTVAGQVDDTFTVTLGSQQIELHQIAVATQFPSAIPNAPFIVVPTRALLERELAVPEPGITLDEVWAMGSTDPRPALDRARVHPRPRRRSGRSRSRRRSRSCRRAWPSA